MKEEDPGYGMAPPNDFRDHCVSATSLTRASAIKNDIDPFSNSFNNTADAGEYDCAAGVDTRE
jgi:hypothetical protein